MKLRYIFVAVFLLIAFVNCDDGAVEQEEEEVEYSTSKTIDPKKEKVKYVKPTPRGAHNFIETFELDSIGTKWIKSRAKKDGVEDTIAKYDGEWAIEASLDSVFDGDKGLVLKSKAKHHAISSKLLKPFVFANKRPLVVQYEVKFQSPLECGGAYVKLLTDEKDLKLENFYDKSSFSIMFGPDKCGNENKYHFIIRFKHPVKGTFEEKHAKKSNLIDSYFSDGKTHLYTLIVRPDSTFQMLIDQTEVNSGSLLNDLTPPINPPKEIVDPNDVKPENWDDREKIPDPDAVKPDDWDENEPKLIPDPNAEKPEGWLDDEEETIPDPTSVKPEDWDDATDGEWEAPKIDNPKCNDAAGCGKWTAPMINNPKYKGKWKAPLIENTNYQGQWEPRKIENPDFFEDNDPFASLVSFSALGLELWSMTDNIYFDNFIITDDESVADQFAKDSWTLKKNLELITSRSSDSVIDGLLNAANDKPWLWAIYVLVILLPIVIISVFCFGKSSPKPPRSDAAESKKTDARTEDDAAEEETLQQEEATEDSKVQSKSDLEPKQNESDDNDAEGEEVEAEDEKNETEPETVQEPEESKVVKRKPGRPRKD